MGDYEKLSMRHKYGGGKSISLNCKQSVIRLWIDNQMKYIFPDWVSYQQLREQVEEQNKSIGDLQRLCERAHLILSEHWGDYTENGYGPSSLLRDLEKVKDGKEYKELRKFSDMVVKKFHDKEQENQQLKDQLSKYREALDKSENILGDGLSSGPISQAKFTVEWFYNGYKPFWYCGEPPLVSDERSEERVEVDRRVIPHFVCTNCRLSFPGDDETGLKATCPECGGTYGHFFTPLIRHGTFALAYWLDDNPGKIREHYKLEAV